MKKTILTLMIILLGLAASKDAFSADARVDDLIVTKSPALSISFLIKDAFTKDIEEAIKSGIPTSFSFYAELRRVNSVWFNEEAGRWVFRHTVKYDSLKEEYEVTRDEAGEKGIRTRDMGEMKRLMVTVGPVRLKSPQPLSRGDEYEIKVMAELKAVEMPEALKYMFFFLKLWDFETDWYIYRFTP